MGVDFFYGCGPHAGGMENFFDANGQLLPGVDHGAGPLDKVLEVSRNNKLAGNTAFGSKNWIGAAKLYAEALRMLQTTSSSLEIKCDLSCGQRVSIRNGESDREGMIACDNGDGTYDIMFDDGDEGDAIPSSLLKPIRVLSKEESEARELEGACWLNSARCAFQLSLFPLAIALASTAIKNNGSNAAAFFIRGRARLAVPTLDDAFKDLKQAVIMQPNNAEYRRIYEECKQRIKTRNEDNRKTAAMMLSYMRSEGVTGS
jgi:tetratricopeptide (TPR) repeat protein